MSSRRRLVYAAAAVAVLALVLTVPAAAQTVTTGTPQGWTGGVCRGVGAVADKVAGLLGMEPGDLANERAAGKSLTDIAQERGVSQDALVGTIVETRGDALQQAVTDGRLTQAQADAMLERMTSRAQERVADPSTAPGCGGPGASGAGCGGPGASAAGCAGAGQAGAGCAGGGGCGGAAASTTGNSL